MVAYEVINFFAFLLNCIGQVVPKVATTTLYISLISFAVILITVPTVPPPTSTHETTKLVFPNFGHSTVWPAGGMDFVVGLINLDGIFTSLDSIMHLSTCSGRSIFRPVLFSFVTTWFYCMAILFSVHGLDVILRNPTSCPILALFQEVENKAGAVALGSIILITGIACQDACHTWQSRLCWSFARDRGLPWSAFLAKIHPTLGIPLNAHAVSCFIVGLLGLSYSGSSTAFSSMVTACMVLVYALYGVSIAYQLWRRRGNIEHGLSWQGRVGLTRNVVVLAWTLLCMVGSSFPSLYPVTSEGMSPSV